MNASGAAIVEELRERIQRLESGPARRRTTLPFGVKEIDQDTFNQTMSVIVKHRTDMDVVADRVGLKLSAPADVA